MQELPQKELTEKEAWIFLSKIFDNESFYYERPFEGLSVNVLTRTVRGLCTAINEMYWNKLISYQVLRLMEDKLYKFGKENGIQELYYWPNTIEGMKQRASFCKLQANSIPNEIPEKPE